MSEQIQRRGAVIVLVVLGALVLAACGSGAGPGAQASANDGVEPAQGGSFAPGAFVNLPKPAGSQPFGPPSDQNGTWAQSFEVTGLSSSDTIHFYDTALGSGWVETSGPVAEGNCSLPNGDLGNGCTYASVWSNDPQTLQVTAGPDGTNTNGSGDGTELSLLLSGAS